MGKYKVYTTVTYTGEIIVDADRPVNAKSAAYREIDSNRYKLKENISIGKAKYKVGIIEIGDVENYKTGALERTW